MPDLIGVSIRRHHICLDKQLHSPMQVRCPDCGSRLFDVPQRLRGSVKHQCRRCKDASGNSKLWIFIFHESAAGFVASVKQESTSIELSKID